MDARCHTCHSPSPFNYCWTHGGRRQCNRVRHDSVSEWLNVGHLHSPVCSSCIAEPALVKCHVHHRVLCLNCFEVEREEHRDCVVRNRLVFAIPFSSHGDCVAPNDGAHAYPAVQPPAVNVNMGVGPPNQGLQHARQQPAVEGAEFCFLCTSSLPRRFCWNHRGIRSTHASTHEFALYSGGHVSSPICEDCELGPALVRCHADNINVCIGCFRHRNCILNRHSLQIIPFSSHLDCFDPNPKPIPEVARKKRGRTPGGRGTGGEKKGRGTGGEKSGRGTRGGKRGRGTGGGERGRGTHDAPVHV